MRFDILTLFPDSIEPYLSSSILGRARTDKKIVVKTWNIRDFAQDKHTITDDTPYGGGAGMVMKVEPIDLALQAVIQEAGADLKRKVIVMSPRGAQFTQAKAHEYTEIEHLIFICGRYEGIDQRVIDHLADEELSIGPYVLSGGEMPAVVVIETVARLLPGVLGNEASLAEESHGEVGSLEYPQYTKPETYKDWVVPEVLLSGNHAAIEAWRKDAQKNN